MVSAQYYIDRLKSSIPQRIKNIRKLREEKQRIDGGVIAGQDLSPGEIKLLIIVLGEDAWYSEAEERPKLTLRRLTYKLLKSANRFEIYYSKFDAEREFQIFKKKLEESRKWLSPLEEREIQERFKAEVISFIEFFSKTFPALKQRLQKLDAIYQQEVLALQKMSDGRKQIQVYAKLLYRKLLNEERSFYLQAEPWYSTIKGRADRFVNLIQIYSSFAKERDEKSPYNGLAAILVGIVFGMFMLTQVIAHISERGFVMEGNWWNLIIVIWTYSATKFTFLRLEGRLKTLADYSVI